MGFFGNSAPRAFMPMLQAAMSGQIPGVTVEDPYAMAQALGIPSPGSFGGPPAVAEASPGAFGGPPATLDAPPLKITYGDSSGPMADAGIRQGDPGVPGGPFSGGAYPPPQQPPPIDMMGPIKESIYQNAMTPRPMYGSPSGQAGNVNSLPPLPLEVTAPKKKKGKVGEFLGHWAGFMGDNLAKNSNYADMLKHKRTMEEKREEERRKAQLPQQVGSSIIVPDGQGGYRTLYRDPSTAEDYALAQGFQPGTEKYSEAVRQYRLGSWNDEAVEAKRGLTGYRYDRQGELQDDRQEHASGMQEDRQGHSSTQFERRDATTRRGQNITRDNSIRSTGQSNTNNQRATGTSRDNNIRSNQTRLQTSRRGRGAGSPVRVNSLEEARRLRPGTVFVTPDGRVKVR